MLLMTSCNIQKRTLESSPYVSAQRRISDPGYITAPHFSRLLRHAWGYGGHILDLNPGSPRGELTLGVYQLKLAKSYTQEHLNENGEYDIFVSDEDPSLLCAKQEAQRATYRAPEHNVPPF